MVERDQDARRRGDDATVVRGAGRALWRERRRVRFSSSPSQNSNQSRLTQLDRARTLLASLLSLYTNAQEVAPRAATSFKAGVDPGTSLNVFSTAGAAWLDDVRAAVSAATPALASSSAPQEIVLQGKAASFIDSGNVVFEWLPGVVGFMFAAMM